MRALDTTQVLLFAAASIVCACATSGPPRPSQVETRSESGFTITEEVQVSPATRADFDRAMQLLEQEQYDSGIALLVELTEAAPQVTAVHIDLGIAYGRMNDLDHAKASIERAPIVRENRSEYSALLHHTSPILGLYILIACTN